MLAKTLDSKTLLWAYGNGYFPMPNSTTEVIEWYFPDPRAILPLDGFHCSKSLTRSLRRGNFRITFDTAFAEVMKGCASRKDTWINAEFHRAYNELHALGKAHSVEVWEGNELVGGVYGVSIGGAFFAESKFHRKTDASKVALFHLVRHLNEKGFSLLEVQFLSPHLETLGVVEIPAEEYLVMLAEAVSQRKRF